MPVQPVLTRRALNRATLERQALLRRSDRSALTMIEDLVGLQAQTPHSAYVGLWTRLEGFRPEHLVDLIRARTVVRMALMRGTIHLVSASDAVALRPLIQPVLDRALYGQFGRRLDGVDRAELIARGRAFVETEPRTFKALGDHLVGSWPGRDPVGLAQGIRAGVPLVQVPPRGLWGQSGPAAHTSIEAWLGPAGPSATMTLEQMVLRYLRAFGPASVKDAQAWCGLTRLGDAFERLRPDLLVFRDELGRELFDLPDSPRPDPDTPAPPRFMYDYENLFLSYADRSRAIPPGLDVRVGVRTNEPISAFLVDGSIAGTWKVDRARDTARLILRVLRPVGGSELTALTDEGERLLTFLAADAGRLELDVVRDIR